METKSIVIQDSDEIGTIMKVYNAADRNVGLSSVDSRGNHVILWIDDREALKLRDWLDEWLVNKPEEK